MKKSMAVVPTIVAVAFAAYIYVTIQDLQEHLTTTERIKAHGYAVEEHTVQTLDGYILKLIRIPSTNNNITSHNNSTTGSRPVAYLQHGLFCSADTWIITPPEVTLAYQLADAGYDVWLGNSRGNFYSKQHAQLAVNSYAFWQFSFHEVGVYDMRAMVDYILKSSQQQALHFIGDSQGSTGFFALLSELPQYNKFIKTAHHLGPAVFVNNSRTPIAKLAPILDKTLLVPLLRNREFMTHNHLLIWLCGTICSSDSMLYPICDAALSYTGGQWHLNATILPALCQTHPAGASTNQLMHFAQLMNVRKFQRFDYGTKLNKRYYNRTTPPEYDLSKVSACSTLYYGDNDLAVDSADVEYLAQILPCAQAHRVPQKNWNHYDFIWSEQAKELINDRIIVDMHRYEGSTTKIAAA